jgi:peptidoglycan-associated lipoprotein
MTVCLAGCTYQRMVELAPTDLPEQVYLTPQENNYEELLRNKVFANVTPELDVSDISLENLVEIAHDRKYDLIITGDLLYYFEGSLHRPSRADERIRVIDAQTEETLWYAKAVDVAPPAAYTDYIFMQGRGMQAPTARTVLKRNAEKFCRMLLSLPPREHSATAQEPNCLAGEEDSRAAQEELDEKGPGEELLGQDAKSWRERTQREGFANEHILFEFDRWRLLPEAKEILRRKAEWLNGNSDVSVVIEGYCDERGTGAYNMSLGDRRAARARDYLVDLGIAPERVTAVSYGEEKPLDPRHNEEAWAKNRRAQLMLEKRQLRVRASTTHSTKSQ